MSNSTYSVSSHDPIAIFPAGSQPAATILNNGASTVYVGELANNNVGWPIAPGNTLGWNKGTPLYAYVDSAAAATSILVSTDGNVLPYGSVVATNTNKVLYSQTAFTPYTYVPITGIEPYASLIIAIAPKFGVQFGNGTFVLTWTDMQGNLLYSESYGFDNQAPYPCQLVTAVKGPIVTLYASSVDILDSVTVAGSTRALKESYMMGGAQPGPLTRSAFTSSVGILPNTAFNWQPRMWAGHNTLSVRCDGITNTGNGFAVELKGPTPGTIYLEQLINDAIAPSGRMYDLLIPPTPVVFVFTNRTAVNQTIYVALVSEL